MSDLTYYTFKNAVSNGYLRRGATLNDICAKFKICTTIAEAWIVRLHKEEQRTASKREKIMKIRAEVELEIDVNYNIADDSHIDYPKLVEESNSWSKCKVLRAERIKDDE